MAKKKPQRKEFKMNTTIKQKQRAYLQSVVVVMVVSAIATYFVSNILSVYFNRHSSFNKFSAWLSSHPLTETVFAPPQSLSLTIVFLLAVVMAYLAVRGYTRITDDITTEAGTAQWGKIREFNARYSLSENPKEPDHYKDMILSKNIRISTEIYYHQTALNMVILGATRSGKSRFFVKPNILQMNCNYVVTDPKGELLEAVGPVLQAFGYKVRVFDIFDKVRCNTYNPFKYITSEEEVATLAQQLMDATKLGGEEGGGGGGESPFWDLSTLALLRACIYLLWKYGEGGEFEDAYVTGGKLYKPCFASVNLLLALAMEREGKVPQNATLEGSYLDEMFCRVKEKHPNTMPYCCIAWDQIKGNPLQPTAATIVANTTTRLNMFTIDRIRDLTSSNNIDLNSFGEQKDAIFLIMNPNDKTFNFLLNMMYSQLFTSMYKRGNKLNGCKYAHLENGEFIRFWRPKKKETKEAFEQRVEDELKAMSSVRYQKHAYDKNTFNANDPSTYYIDILDANGVQISARPNEHLAKEFVKDLAHMKVENMHGTMFPFHNRFIIDEFFNVGKIPNFLTVLSTIAGYNGSCDVILQDINQIKSMYDKDWGSVFGNCPVNLVLKVADNETAKYVSESLGKATIAHAQEKASQTNLKSGTDYGIEVKQRDLMTADEVKTLPNTQEIIIVSGENPLIDNKHPYTTHPLYKYTSDETKIPFNRDKYTIPPAKLVKEVLMDSGWPEIIPLSAEKIVELFSPEDSEYGFQGFEEDDDYDYDSYPYN